MAIRAGSCSYESERDRFAVKAILIRWSLLLMTPRAEQWDRKLEFRVLWILDVVRTVAGDAGRSALRSGMPELAVFTVPVILKGSKMASATGRWNVVFINR